MAKKRTSVRIDERLFDDMAEFCRKFRITQEGMFEGAIYWLIHEMPREEFFGVMDKTTQYIDSSQSVAKAANLVAKLDQRAATKKNKGKAG